MNRECLDPIRLGVTPEDTYASYPLTGVTALASVLSMALSELFIRWDPTTERVFESTQRLSNFLIALFVLIAFSGSYIVVIRFERKKNLTGVQKGIESRADRALYEAKRTRDTLYIL